MKRDLERYRDKMTPEEERRVWSKMKDGLRGAEPRGSSWVPRLWLSRAVVAAAVVLAAAVIWHADLLTPERVMKEDLAVLDEGMQAGSRAEPETGAKVRKEEGAKARTKAGAQTESKASPQAPEGVVPGAPTEIGPEGKEEAPAAAGLADREETAGEEGAAESKGEGGGVMMKVPPEKRVYEEAREATEPESAKREAAEPGTPEAAEPGERGATKSVDGKAERPEARELPEPAAAEKKKALMPKTDYYEEEDGWAVRRSAGESSRVDRGEPVEALTAARVQAAASAAESASSGGLEEEPEMEAAVVRAGERSAMKAAEVAGAGEIRGQVTDSQGNPLPNANVIVVGTRFGAMADEAGSFRIRNLPAGTYTLMVTYIGYEDLVIPNVVVERDRTVDLAALVLGEPGIDRADTIYVTGAKPEIRVKRSESTASLPVERLMSAPMMEQGSIAGTSRMGPGKKRYPSLTGGRVPVNDELADDMFFRHYGTNPFIEAEEDALSTFALDVDTGSYTICRRYINEGSLPPPEAVRVEEFVNFFVKDFDPPRHGDFAICIDGMPSPFAHVQDGSYRLIRVGIRGRVIDDRHRKPAQIVLVIDTSGSMGMGNRLSLLKDSMKVLLDELRADDEIGIVEFGTEARVVLPLTPLSEDREIYRAIESLSPNGSTNAEHGLKLGYKMMRREAREGRLHRIIFCSDGVANVGATGWESILESVRRDSDEISLSTIGFGMGNYNDILMEQLADAGDGQYAYVDNMRAAKRVLRENLTGTLQTIAKEAKAQIEFNPKYVAKYRLLGYENRDVRDEDFRNDEIDAGEIGAGHEVTVLYEVKLKSKGGRGRAATVRLRYEKPEGGEVIEMDEPFSLRDLSQEVEDAPADLVVDACVAEFAEILRRSYWAKDGSLEDVLDLLDETAERMTSRPEVDELMSLVKKAIALQDSEERPRRDYREE